MIDDVRRPRSKHKNDDDLRPKPAFGSFDPKDENFQDQGFSLEAPHVYDDEQGFASSGTEDSAKNPDQIPKNTSRKTKLKNFFKLKHASKKQKIFGAVVILILVLGGIGASYALTQHFKNKNKPAAPVTQVKEEPKSTTEASKLSGVQVTPDINQKPIISIQIENSPEARPQSGLLGAGVVFEAIAEGGITRFNASYLENKPDYIGPIRSVRPYYAVLVAPFEPVFVHAGGSAAGLAKISELGLKDMDHGANGGAFQRVSDRRAPHNLYSSYAQLEQASQARGYSNSDAKSLDRKEEKPAQPVTAGNININFSTALYNTNYTYNPTSNSYNRNMGGRAHLDHRSGTQISPKVVVALVTGYSKQGIYSVYNTTGSGKVYIFQDGEVKEGTWSKAGDKDQFKFADANGNTLALNPGQTWFSLVAGPSNVSFTP